MLNAKEEISVVEELKSVVFVITVIVSVVASFFAIKYKTEANTTKIEEEEDDIKDFKTSFYKELKDIDLQIKELNMNLQSMLTKKEAEERYISKKEMELTLKNLDLRFLTIIEKLDDLKQRR